MITTTVGVESGTDAFAVGADAYRQANEKLDGTEANLALVFASVEYDQEQVLAGVRSISQDVLVLGASTAGEITTNGPVDRHSVVVMLIATDQITFNATVAEGIKENATEVGQQIGTALKDGAPENLQLVMMFSDSLSGNVSNVLRGMMKELGEHFPIVGGSAGDDAAYKKTYQYLNEKAYSNAASAVGFSGDFKFGVGVKHGWVPVGLPMTITKSEGAVLHELNGEPAIKIYEDYFGKEEADQLKEKTLAKTALSYPIGITAEGSDELLLRAPFFVDKNGSITCGGEVPEGSEVRLMVGGRTEAIEAARAAAIYALEQLDGTPKAAILFNCHVRDKMFGEHSQEEIATIQEIIGKDTPLVGFYTYAEQAPIGGEVRNIGKCNPAFHNETIVILLLGE